MRTRFTSGRTCPWAALLAATFAAAALAQDRDTLQQVSTIQALKGGAYDGCVTYGELKRAGDFGIGTFDAIDGEMIELDGVVYQVKLDGSVHVAPDDATAPYATVTFFDADRVFELAEPLDYAGLQRHVDTLLPTLNIPYALRVRGTFSYVKARSVPAQEKPYPSLGEVVNAQQVFEFHDVEGTAVGFRFPAFMDGVQAPGYHLHFITDDGRGGGHLLDCRIGSVEIAADDTREFNLLFPQAADAYAGD